MSRPCMCSRWQFLLLLPVAHGVDTPHCIYQSSAAGHGVVSGFLDVFLELSCFFDDPVDVDNLISGSSAFSKTSSNIRKFTGHVLLKPVLENFEHYFTSMWDQCNCAVVWAFFGLSKTSMSIFGSCQMALDRNNYQWPFGMDLIFYRHSGLTKFRYYLKRPQTQMPSRMGR